MTFELVRLELVTRAIDDRRCGRDDDWKSIVIAYVSDSWFRTFDVRH